MVKTVVFGIAVVAALVGCGGGGGSTNTQSPPPVAIDPNLTVPLRAALASITTKGLTGSFAISGATGGPANIQVTGTGTATLSPGIPDTLNGSAVIKSTQALTGSMTVSGSPTTALSTSSLNFTSSTDSSRIADESAAAFTVYTAYTVPTSAKAGDAGPAWLSTMFKDRTQITLPGVGRVVATYSASKDTATSLLVTILVDTYGDTCNLINTSSVPTFCLTNLGRDYVFNVRWQQSETVYRIDTSGSVKLISIRQDAYGPATTPYQRLLFSF